MAVIREETPRECSHLTDSGSGFSEMEEAKKLSPSTPKHEHRVVNSFFSHLKHLEAQSSSLTPR